MVVDLAHPDCGLLSLFVVRPLSEQSRHREEGDHGGGRRFVEYSCHSAPPNLAGRKRETHRRTKTERQSKICE